MDTLHVAWQEPDSKEWIPVAVLTRRENGNFRFFYTQGVLRAKNFKPFSGMDELETIYESETLFPVFSNRLISRNRPEFKDYLRWMGLDNSNDDPMSILALTGGIRGTDSVELFAPPTFAQDGSYNLEFFARSLLFLDKQTLEAIGQFKPGTQLYLMKDVQNSVDRFAIALRSNKPILFVGYCPRYYAKNLGNLLASEDSELTIHVKCANPEAPLNMRLLCKLSAKHPDMKTRFVSDSDFQQLASH